MTITRTAGIDSIAVRSNPALHHMTVDHLLTFATEVRQAVAEGLDPDARIEVTMSTTSHLISLSCHSNVRAELRDPS